MKPEQPNYANDHEFFAKEPPLQLTLRVMQAIYSNSKFWIGAVAVIAILTVAGPFDTLNDLEFAPRLVYWAAISLVTWPMGMGCSIYFGVGLFQRGVPEWIARIIGGLIGGIPIGFFVWAINKYIAGNDIGTFEDLVRLIGYTTIISAAVSILYYLLESSVRPEGQSTSLANGSITSHVQTPTSPFFGRLPVEQSRGEVEDAQPVLLDGRDEQGLVDRDRAHVGDPEHLDRAHAATRRGVDDVDARARRERDQPGPAPGARGRRPVELDEPAQGPGRGVERRDPVGGILDEHPVVDDVERGERRPARGRDGARPGLLESPVGLGRERAGEQERQEQRQRRGRHEGEP